MQVLTCSSTGNFCAMAQQKSLKKDLCVLSWMNRTFIWREMEQQKTHYSFSLQCYPLITVQSMWNAFGLFERLDYSYSHYRCQITYNCQVSLNTGLTVCIL